ncbi:hypothetical protein N9I48_01830 [Candidatus Pelagibacter sp.]|nr:hypothetical protein [Candidatus Pelagibacter sp.]|tara:strand:+ start:194 stop:799 length:606 start_codon:yes stop_codon:yes gene_type:complete
MTKIKKRNELSIFNDFRIKPPTTSINVEDYPKKEDLHSLKLLSKVDKNNNTTSWWKKNIDGKLVQVNQLGEVVFSGDKDYLKEIPIESSLKKNQSKILVTINKYEAPISWWVKNLDGDLIQINIKDKDPDTMLRLKSLLRNQAIDIVGLEIRSMKKKAYEYSKNELERMIKEEEKKIIKKKGWMGIRILAATMGIGFVPFI